MCGENGENHVQRNVRVCVLRVHRMLEKFAYNKYHGSFQLTNYLLSVQK